MDEVETNYEEPVTVSMYDVDWTCEYDGCNKKATTEWMSRDEDGDVYATDRCDDHPETDPDFGPNDL